MTCAYVPVKELDWADFKAHLQAHGFDIEHYGPRECVKLLETVALYFDKHMPPRTLQSRLDERIQV